MDSDEQPVAMDCPATLPVDERGEDEPDGGEVWGRLFPLGKGFVLQGMAVYKSCSVHVRFALVMLFT